MRYLCLATDYDGTLATHGLVDQETVEALKRFLNTGRKLVMVTGRELDELLAIFPQVDLFEWIVAENGALLYRPATKEETPLAVAPPEAFIQELTARGVERVSAGRVIVATWEPHETTCLEVIRDLGLELQMIFNKGSVMILPTGVNKATGLAEALKRLDIAAHSVVAIGDAENDHALLQMCGCAVAVANALSTLKENADLVTDRDHGAGVTELIERLIADDLAGYEPKLTRQAAVKTSPA